VSSVIGKEGNCHLGAHQARVLAAFLAVAPLLQFSAPTLHAEARETSTKSKTTAIPAKPPTKPIAQTPRPDTPLTLLVSIRKQRVRVIDGFGEVTSSRISSGQPGFDTPTGVFSILEKHEYHESNIYEGAPMPHMQRVTWSGIALHAGIVPGYRASHGCIRLPASFARSLFKQTIVGARVIITNDETSPVKFEDDLLIRPLPAVSALPAQSTGARDMRVAANDVQDAGDAQLPSFMPVTPAHAETAPPAAPEPQKPRSRAEAAQMLESKILRLQAEMKTAETQKAAASEKAQATLRPAQEAEARLKTARQPFEGVLRNAAAADSARKAAIEKFRAFMAATSPIVDSKARLQLEDKEAELEDRILDLTIEADAARAEAAKGEMVIADVQATFAAAESAKNRAIDEVKTAVAQLRSAQTALIEAQKDVARRARPLSVFVSFKAKKIYVRQGFEPLLEAPLDIADSPGAIGTHVLTAMDYDATGDRFSWQLISAQAPRLALADQDQSKKRKQREQSAPNLNDEAVRVALESFRIPQEIQDTIADLAKPGMSLIISDRELSKETGKGTEFVVLTR
jgi:L,D-transpeptidase catalytic domain